MPENLRPIETFRSRRAGERSEAIDRCADVRAFRDAAPRHCGTDVAAPRRLYHGLAGRAQRAAERRRSEEHTSELQSLMRISYAVFCLKKKKKTTKQPTHPIT